MSQTLDSHSRFISLVLRHQPQAIGLALDEQGWASLDDLVAKARAAGRQLSREVVLDIVRDSDKQRFAISADGLRIRANQGHSVRVDLGLAAQAAPPRLFHGTARRFLAAIRAEGLRPGQRHHVHLSDSAELAASVGARHGAPVVLTVDAAAMQRAGLAFYQSANGVWLADAVPPQFLAFPE
ncbi:RNA 2'-phosphotransferase [Chromobacterium subtsugae]|uniref:RNA 2'-phosphotransferase n=1 Tax=Chromobacterium subtsugae TaxID=251747 RepID=UPI0006417BDB|nr:RNA 2'-phosphotransferase [Chromobacterium subtsugae]